MPIWVRIAFNQPVTDDFMDNHFYPSLLRLSTKILSRPIRHRRFNGEYVLKVERSMTRDDFQRTLDTASRRLVLGEERIPPIEIDEQPRPGINDGQAQILLMQQQQLQILEQQQLQLREIIQHQQRQINELIGQNNIQLLRYVQRPRVHIEHWKEGGSRISTPRGMRLKKQNEVVIKFDQPLEQVFFNNFVKFLNSILHREARGTSTRSRNRNTGIIIYHTNVNRVIFQNFIDRANQHFINGNN
jgi:hypothetical protein